MTDLETRLREILDSGWPEVTWVDSGDDFYKPTSAYERGAVEEFIDHVLPLFRATAKEAGEEGYREGVDDERHDYDDRANNPYAEKEETG